jgi:SAM-dependent methyltransferase
MANPREGAVDFSTFDTRNYQTVSAREGYGEWSATYERTVLEEMDWRLLDRVRMVPWAEARRTADLACGTGRTGVWLREHGVGEIDGVDLTPEMLQQARDKGIYARLLVGDMTATPLDASAYDLVTEVLADEHIPDVGPLYREAARLARPGGHFVLVGYHPFFLMSGIPTHFDRASGEPLAIESHVHLFSEHIGAALEAGWALVEMHEGVVDDAWLVRKPKWERYRSRPVSFVMVWERRG